MPFLIDKVLMPAKISVEFVTCIYIKLNDDQSINHSIEFISKQNVHNVNKVIS